MLVQEYLKDHTYEDLEKNFGISVNEYDDRVTLNYHQIDSHKHKFDPMVMECRGLILSKPDHKVLCRSFDRFWNFGEDPKTEKFDITQAVVTEKVDGTLINVYHDGEKWCTATRKMAFAEGMLPNGKMSYAELFEDAIGDDIQKVFEPIHKDLVIIFELTAPENRVVTPYKDRKAYLLAVRARDTGLLLSFEETYYWTITDKTKWFYPEKFAFKTWEDVLEASKALPAMEEGYVANQDQWRIKIKNPAYLAIAHLRENGAITEKRVVRLVFMQDHEEYLQHFPEDRPEFEPYIKAYNDMVEDINARWEANKDIEDQKEFALAIKDCPAQGVLFAIRKGKNLYDIIEGLNDNYKIRMLKGYVK